MAKLKRANQGKSSFRPGKTEDCTKFMTFFVGFVWTVWDFILKVEIEGHRRTNYAST